MKRIVVIIVFIACALNVFSQKHLGEFSLHPKFKKPPYNFEWVTKELSAMLCEVSVD